MMLALRLILKHWPRLLGTTFLTFPAELFFAWLALAKGVPALLNIKVGTSIPEASYPAILHIGWGAQLVFGGTAILVGLLIRRVDLRVVGFKVLTLATCLDLFTIILSFGVHRPAYTIIYIGFALCCALKVISLSYVEMVSSALSRESNGHGER